MNPTTATSLNRILRFVGVGILVLGAFAGFFHVYSEYVAVYGTDFSEGEGEA